MSTTTDERFQSDPDEWSVMLGRWRTGNRWTALHAFDLDGYVALGWCGVRMDIIEVDQLDLSRQPQHPDLPPDPFCAGCLHEWRKRADEFRCRQIAGELLRRGLMGMARL